MRCAKLSLKPLLIEGIGEDEDSTSSPETSKFETVRAILRDVQKRGDAAVIDYTARFDKTTLTAATMRISAQATEAAVKTASPKFLHALDIAIKNIRHYQLAMLTKEPAPIQLPNGGGRLGVKFTPLERVGLYVPGGAAAYPTSVLHTAIPAQIAGVKDICLCSPMRDGAVSPAVLTAAHKLNITEIYAIGGAQAIAAMAFGTQTIKPVDKIVGPGNTYVQLAKKELFGIVDIDSFAGPSEVIVLADDTAAPSKSPPNSSPKPNTPPAVASSSPPAKISHALSSRKSKLNSKTFRASNSPAPPSNSPAP